MPNDSQIDDQNDGFEDNFEPRPPLNQLNKNQKLAASGLAVFAVLIVVLWLVQLKNNIYGPFNSNTTTSGSASIDSQTASDLALKNKDTDGDGLSDYDELNLYKTSPYLADSDSDGIKDDEEVKNGADPNCPQGRTCFSGGNLDGSAAATSSSALPAAGLGNPSSQNDVLNNLLNQSGAVDSALGSGAGTGANSGTSNNLTTDQLQALKNIDAASLRQLLLDAGMPKEALDKISDTELMKSYSETLNSQTGQ